jgi:hypothetical protein
MHHRHCASAIETCGPYLTMRSRFSNLIGDGSGAALCLLIVPKLGLRFRVSRPLDDLFIPKKEESRKFI